MSYYNTCPDRRNNSDPCEKCDCKPEKPDRQAADGTAHGDGSRNTH